MLRIALEYDGTVDRLVGDGIAVFFGAPAEQPDHAARAVRCALSLDVYCESFRVERLARGLQVGVTRIGVHTGPAVVGNVGSAMRFHYTAHGDCVNTAARLEGANKHLGTRICMSEAVAEQCPNAPLKPAARLVLRGKTRGIDCVTLTEGLSEQALADYLAAYEALARNDSRSAAMFAALHRRLPHDRLIAFHWRRLQRGETGNVVVLRRSE